ncbi:MAG TPA: hypothetical protein VMM56_16725 [Planctomycetaceae bacterium]|nr:hypothetical protein [Planctomycetaceae bacterium]
MLRPYRLQFQAFKSILDKAPDSKIAQEQGIPKWLAFSGGLPTQSFDWEKKIVELRIGSADSPTPDLRVLSDDLIELRFLQSLVLHGHNIDNDDMEIVKNLESLNAIYLLDTRVDDQGLRLLSELKLTQLSLGSEITDEGVRYACERWPELLSFGLHSSKVSDSSITSIVTLEHLQYLNLNDTLISIASLESLEKLTSLNHLRLDNTSLTDESVPYLSKLTGLRTLSVEESRITEKGLQELRSHLPNCRVIGPMQ